MIKFEIFLATALLPHLILASITQFKIVSTTYLNPYQKIFNSIMNWVIPYLWGFLVRAMIAEPKHSVVTKQNRRRNSGSNSDNWEGLTGYGGDAGSGMGVD